MTASRDLFCILDEEGPDGALREWAFPWMEKFRRQRMKRGSCVPIAAQDDGLEAFITRAHLRYLCSEFLAGNLDEWELEYVANALDLSPGMKPENDLVQECIFRLSSPEVNEPITHDAVLRICSELSA